MTGTIKLNHSNKFSIDILRTNSIEQYRNSIKNGATHLGTEEELLGYLDEFTKWIPPTRTTNMLACIQRHKCEISGEDYIAQAGHLRLLNKDYITEFISYASRPNFHLFAIVAWNGEHRSNYPGIRGDWNSAASRIYLQNSPILLKSKFSS